MAKLLPMAPDSAGFKVLARLYDLGGGAHISELTDILWREFRSTNRFAQVATKPLVQRGLVTTGVHARLTITPEGRMLIEAYRRSVAAPRVVQTNTKPLDLQKHMRFEPRVGSLDYRDKPSIMGGKRIPYHRSNGGSGDV